MPVFDCSFEVMEGTGEVHVHPGENLCQISELRWVSRPGSGYFLQTKVEGEWVMVSQLQKLSGKVVGRLNRAFVAPYSDKDLAHWRHVHNTVRQCGHCQSEIHRGKRSDAKWCSKRCRVAATRARAKDLDAYMEAR